ncbi:MAG: homocysteine S-methyltransferase [Gammaproteobacteria bacterium]|nr:homocysteine S-methyltransferase [Gammaproteobacteria bacterium]
MGRTGPILLDGGLATQLEAQGCDIGNRLWSASLLASDTQAIVDASRAYLDAGAECIATASYQASREGFATLGFSASDADDLMLLSVELAKRAREEFLADNPECDRAVLIAASVGPYGAALHDGSEYTGHYDANADDLRAFHNERLQLFDGSDADVLALETIPSLTEAKVLSELLRRCETPAWVSFSCADEQHISDGTPLVEVARLFRDHPTVLAVGVNCTPPQYVPSLIRTIRTVLPDTAILAYPNSGETYDVTTNSWSGTVSPLDCATAAVSWVSAGAKLVGGCCRMGPLHIRAMATRLKGNKQ